jgi:hypothetical protein
VHPATRRIIAHAYGAIGAPMPAGQQGARPASLPALGAALLELPAGALVGTLPSGDAPDRPPTGPGSPAVAAATLGVRTTRALPALKLVAPASSDRIAGPPSRPHAHQRSRQGVRTPAATETVEAQARAAWQPGMSVSQLERAAGISRNAAGKWRKVLMAEASAAQSDTRATQ